MSQFSLKPEPCADGPFKGYYKLDRINSVAKRDRTVVFNNLSQLINEDNLRQAFRGLDGSRAVGIDHVTKDHYKRNLQSNLEGLLDEIRRGGWRPKPSREVLIPKPTGGFRSLAVGCLEDKIVQSLVAKILEAIYEPRFRRESYGFRPKRTAHQALSSVYTEVNKRGKHAVIVEMDIEKFFNNINHEKLISFLEERIREQSLLRLIRRMLRNSILSQDGTLVDNSTGTPQGSPISPILANIYLHHVLDEWFDKNFIGKAQMVRYADDAVFIFDDLQAATSFKADLAKRFEEYDLKLNEDKSGIVELKPKSGNTIAFLGFVLYWGKTRITKTTLKVKTAPVRIGRAIQFFDKWIKGVRHKLRTKEIWKLAGAKLRGHYNYYAVTFNSRALAKYFFHCIRSLYKWLNRRSQKRSFTWEQFKRKLMFNPLPQTPMGYQLIDITRKFSSELQHKPKSRMRKSRTSGSERSSGQQRPLFT